MRNYHISAFISLLRELDSLSDAVIVEEYTEPTMPRPVINKMVSVGLKSVSGNPLSRGSYGLNAEIRIRLLFPCGVGENDIGTTADEIINRFVGENLQNCFVKSISCGESTFDSTAYAIRSTLILQVEIVHEYLNGVKPTLTLGELEFPQIPDNITVSRPKFKEEEQENGSVTRTASPREFCLKGHCFNGINSQFYEALNTLTASTSSVSLTLPYLSSVTVRCKEMEISFDSCAFGFDYSIVLIEKL